MSVQNQVLIDALHSAFPQFFIEVDEDGKKVPRLDLETLRQHVGEGNYTDKYGLRWENKPEKFEADSVGKLPTLKHVPSRAITTNPDKPTHILIEGDNYHALQVLAYTHERSVDVIYIDPPYNTGHNDFKYNDRYVDETDEYRHSKWLSFMGKRLRLAKTLLAEAGIIFISIDENEQAQLKLLCDEIYGEANLLAMFTWERTGHGTSLGKHVVRTTEFVLCYARRRAAAPVLFGALADPEMDIRLTHKGNGLSTLVFPAGTEVRVANGRYNSALPGRDGSPVVELLSPVDVMDGRSIGPITLRGRFRWSQVTLNGEIAAGTSVYFKTGTFVPNALRWDQASRFKSLKTLLPCAEFGSTQNGTELVSDVIGSWFKTSKMYPKPVELIRRLLLSVLRKQPNALVLDFFAGSGTTAHAVMQLNAEDGGSRQCVLVTNDEGEFKIDQGSPLPGGICTHVTYPRLRKVIEGYTTPNGKEVKGLGENLAFFQTAFHPVPETRSHTQAFAAACVPMLNLKSNCFTIIEQTSEWVLFTGNGKHLFVLLDDIAAEAARERLASVSGTIDAYVFAYEPDDDSAQLLGELPNVTVQEIPRPVLDLFHRLRSQQQ